MKMLISPTVYPSTANIEFDMSRLAVYPDTFLEWQFLPAILFRDIYSIHNDQRIYLDR